MAHLLSYRDLKAELNALAAVPTQDFLMPAHENVRGDTYYH